jgi:hypothetical protein
MKLGGICNFITIIILRLNVPKRQMQTYFERKKVWLGTMQVSEALHIFV